MHNEVGRIIILIEDYDKTLEFYQRNFGFEVLFDATEGQQRYLHLGTKRSDGSTTGLWFLKAHGASAKRIGEQTGGEPVMVIYTSDLKELYETLRGNNVPIVKEPVFSDEYKFLHCEDLYGNEIVVVEL